MKKNKSIKTNHSKEFRKNLKFLKEILVSIFFLSFSLSMVSQTDTRITIHAQDKTIKDVLNQIEKNSRYLFFFSDNIAPLLKTVVTVQMKAATIQQIMDKTLENCTLTYTIKGNQISILKKETVPPKSRKITIKGKVTDTEGLPLIGGNVIDKQSGTGTVTNANGEFEIDIYPKDDLVISYLGYQSKTLSNLSDKKELAVKLVEDAKLMDEVVIVGYGRQKKVNLTGSLTTVDMKKLANQPNANVAQALHGVSGLWVNQAGGKPGADGATLRIRGVGTLNNSDPLVLVDGIEYNINEINPEFIENITVLKDASAAIYGSRAANGVILITTKQGSKSKSKVEYNFSFGWQTPTRMPNAEWDAINYMELKNKALKNEGINIPEYSPELIADYKIGMNTDPLAYPSIDWFDQVLKTGYIQQHNLSLSGGNDKVLYHLGLGYMDQDGILIAANHANRYTLNLNIMTNVTKRLKLGGSVLGNYRTYTEPPLGDNATDFFFNRLMRSIPIFGSYLPDGRYANLAVPTTGRSGYDNQIQALKEGSNKHEIQRILANVQLDYQFPFNISYNIKVGADMLNGYQDQFQPIMITYSPQTWEPSFYNKDASSKSYNERVMHMTLTQALNWNWEFNKKHTVKLMLGQSYERYNRQSTTATIEGFNDNLLTDLNAGSLNPTVKGGTSQDILASYFGRAEYNFDERYLAEFTYRYDGSSRFARGKRWGGFPAGSIGWRVDREPFFESASRYVNLLKVRASIGKMGNQRTASYYGYMNTISLNQDYSFGGVLAPGAAATTQGDPSITWEETVSYNAGVDVELLRSTIVFGADIFTRRTSGILRPTIIAAQVGALAGPTGNVGVVDNKGFELALTYRNNINQFRYEVSGSLGYVENKVIDLKGEEIISGRRITKEGYPINSFYLYESDGLYQTPEEVRKSATVSNKVKPGYIRYKDKNEDDIIDGEDRIITGSAIPKLNYSFSLNLAYRGVSLGAYFQGVHGVNCYASLNLATPFFNGAGVTKEWITDSWTPDNREAKLPILTTASGASENYVNSTYWMKDASYLRMKNLQLSYTLPKKYTDRIKCDKLLLFVNAQNLLTFSPYKLFDPEKNLTNDTMYEYPSLKTFSVGVNIAF